MGFDERLEQAIQRGQRRLEAKAEAERKAKLTEEEFRRLYAQHRLALADRIEDRMQHLPNHFPGFQYESMMGDRGWGGACFREDIRISKGPGLRNVRSSDYSRLELTVRPYSPAHLLELTAKGTVRNKEVFSRSYYEELDEADLEKFLGLVDLWVLEYAEMYSASE